MCYIKRDVVLMATHSRRIATISLLKLLEGKGGDMRTLGGEVDLADGNASKMRSILISCIEHPKYNVCMKPHH